MSKLTRRDFVTYTASGLAVVGAGSIVLPADAAPTPSSGGLGSYGAYAQDRPRQPDRQPERQPDQRQPDQRQPEQRPANWNPTEDNILGPFHRRGAPYRAKITPPSEPGNILLISGRVFGHDTRRALPNTVIDIWQANSQGRYDNDDPKNPPPANVFVNRARIITDENGYYEYETIHPGAYRIDKNTWRPPHVHYWIRNPNYRELVTQLYFRGDEHQKGDNWIRDSLIIPLREVKNRNGAYKTGTFDIVLRPRPAKGK